MVIKPGPFRFEFMTHNIGQCQNYKWGVNNKKAQQFYTDSPYRNIVDYFSNLRPSRDLFCLQEVEIDLDNMKVNTYVNGRFQIDGVTYEYIMKPYNQKEKEKTVLIDYNDVPYKITNDSEQIECPSPTELAEQKFNKHICIAVVWNVAKFRLENWKETDDLKNLLPKNNKARALYVNLKCINGSIIHVVSYHGTNNHKFKISKKQLQNYMSNWKRKYFIMAGDFNRTVGDYITKLPPISTSYSQLRENKGSPIDHVIYQNVIPIGDTVEIPKEFICTTTACDASTDIIPYISDYDHLPIVQEFEIASGGGGSKSTATPGGGGGGGGAKTAAGKSGGSGGTKAITATSGDGGAKTTASKSGGGDGGDDDRDGSDVDGEGGADDERDGSDVGGDGGEDERGRR
jgi:hypothetical protein